LTYLDKDGGQGKWADAEHKLALDFRSQSPGERRLAIRLLFRLPSVHEIDGEVGEKDSQKLTPVTRITWVEELTLAKSIQ
jgi:hypothetical protein